MIRPVAWLVVFAVLAGCQCRRPGPVDPIELGLRVEPTELDFGRTLEGTTRSLELRLTSTTRAALAVQLSTDAPFSAPASATVPGGEDATVAVTFRAGTTEAEGVLRLTVGERTAEVRLRGVGVRPLDCRPTAECRVSTYSLEEDRCIETQAADDAPCDPASLCLEQGRCRAGQCLGVARRCDDNDKCTDDACAMDVGCVHTPHTCPRPTAPCQVAACDPTSGCGQRPAPDQSLCGPVNCVEANFCVQGACITQPTPEGVPCAPPVACLPEGVCRNQRCTRVNEAQWTPDWTTRLEAEPTGELSSSGSTLFFSVCGDGGWPDADAGLDGGVDAGLQLACGLTSFTGTGFERFTQPYDDGAPRAVWAVGALGVVLARDGGLEVRSPMNGSLRASLPLEVAREHLVVAGDRLYAWADGGLWLSVDGGLVALAPLEGPSTLARGDALFAWNADAGRLTRLEPLEDGGFDRVEVLIAGEQTPVLNVVGASVSLGAVGRLDTRGDAGLVRYDWTDAGATRVLEALTTSSALSTNVFFQRCVGGCSGPDVETAVRVFDPLTGAPLWDARIAEAGVPASLVASSLVSGPAGVFTVLVRKETPQGSRTSLELYGEGERRALCHLPPSSGAVELAHFTTNALVVTTRRSDGGLVLESYDLQTVPISRSGWPTPQGVAGTRSDQP